ERQRVLLQHWAGVNLPLPDVGQAISWLRKALADIRQTFPLSRRPSQTCMEASQYLGRISLSHGKISIPCGKLPIPWEKFLIPWEKLLTIKENVDSIIGKFSSGRTISSPCLVEPGMPSEASV
ncbi:MAG: hypothetical protein ACTHKU_06375, partial [Verrucomicrobiota bacterium]